MSFRFISHFFKLRDKKLVSMTGCLVSRSTSDTTISAGRCARWIREKHNNSCQVDHYSEKKQKVYLICEISNMILTMIAKLHSKSRLQSLRLQIFSQEVLKKKRILKYALWIKDLLLVKIRSSLKVEKRPLYENSTLGMILTNPMYRDPHDKKGGIREGIRYVRT